MVFNIIPIPPLDGAKVLGMFLPNKAYYTMLRYERYSMLLIMVLSLTGVLNGIIGTGVNFFFNGIINLLNSAINLILYGEKWIRYYISLIRLKVRLTCF